MIGSYGHYCCKIYGKDRAVGIFGQCIIIFVKLPNRCTSIRKYFINYSVHILLRWARHMLAHTSIPYKIWLWQMQSSYIT